MIIHSGKPGDVLSSDEITEFEKGDMESSDTVEAQENEVNRNADDGVLTEEEERETGVVKFDVYRTYWRAVGACLAPSILVSLFLMQGMILQLIA